MERFSDIIGVPDIKTEVFISRHACGAYGLVDTGRSFFLLDGGVPGNLDLPRDRVTRIPGGEAVKTLEVMTRVINSLVLAGMKPGDRLVAIGGGAVMDLAGMIAGLLFRGVPLVNCPTTAVGMVDAAVGGKTGVDLAWGKNLVGLFKFADSVVVDPEFLSTLDTRDLYSGLFEAMKTSLLAGVDLWNAFVADAQSMASGDIRSWSRMIPRCLKYKMDVVKQDPLDQGPRHVLNLGHTLGHALETATDFRVYRHGEAVLAGLLTAMRISLSRGMDVSFLTDNILAVLKQLPVPRIGDVDVHDLYRAMKLDKKAGKWVLLQGPGQPVTVDDVSFAEMKQSFDFTRDFLSSAPGAYVVDNPGPVVLILHGPNMQRLGTREQRIYGQTTYAELLDRLRNHAAKAGLRVEFFQSDLEGDLVRAVNMFAGRIHAVLVNAGAFTHTSVALRDALAGLGVPIAEVHITAVSQRESFRQRSLIKPIADFYVEGQGTDGYIQAIDSLSKALSN